MAILAMTVGWVGVVSVIAVHVAYDVSFVGIVVVDVVAVGAFCCITACCCC